MKLATWIDKNGGTGKTAKILGVKRNNVYAWHRGLALPRPRLLKLITVKSNGRVGMVEMINDHLVRLDRKKTKTVKATKGKTLGKKKRVFKKAKAVSRKPKKKSAW